MSEELAFARLVGGLSPWLDRLVFVGGWAFRLYRLHPVARVPAYQAVRTLDADVAFAENERIEGSIRERLQIAGFRESLSGNHRPPVARYTLDDDTSGFYAEFLTPLSGSGRRRTGETMATLGKAGVTAQRLRHLELLLLAPWEVLLGRDWDAAAGVAVRVPNPVSFLVQRLLIHDQRLPDKKAQDILYVHDTLELFGSSMEHLAGVWRDSVRPALHERQRRRLALAVESIFGRLDDRIRDAAAIPTDRRLDPRRMQWLCRLALGRLLE